MSVKLTILPGQTLKVEGKWKGEGETVTVEDDYRAAVLVESNVAEPASTKKGK